MREKERSKTENEKKKAKEKRKKENAGNREEVGKKVRREGRRKRGL